jgi:hypothetical protein
MGTEHWLFKKQNRDQPNGSIPVPFNWLSQLSLRRNQRFSRISLIN